MNTWEGDQLNTDAKQTYLEGQELWCNMDGDTKVIVLKPPTTRQKKSVSY